MSFPDDNPDKEYDAWVDRQEIRFPHGPIHRPYHPSPRRRLRYWLRTIWRLIVPGGPRNG